MSATMMLTLLLVFSSFSLAAESVLLQETVRSARGEFLVRLHEQKVVVEKQPGKGEAPPHLRLRIHRKDGPPLEVRLHTLDDRNQLYTGTPKGWNGSMIGFELEFSFDQKSWMRAGQRIRKLLP